MKLDENQKSDEEEMLIYAFNTYYEKVFGFFCGHLYDRTLSQDMTGEVFLRVAASWQKYDKTKGAISTWIFTIAQNVMKDYWKKRSLFRWNFVKHRTALMCLILQRAGKKLKH